MTTTYDVEQTESAPVFHDADPTEVVSAYDDPQTVIAAWSSSALGELDGELTDGFTETRERQPAAARAKLFAAVAAGIIGGATLGAVLFGYRDIAPPTVVVPGFGVSTEQLPGSRPRRARPPMCRRCRPLHRLRRRSRSRRLLNRIRLLPNRKRTKRSPRHLPHRRSSRRRSSSTSSSRRSETSRNRRRLLPSRQRRSRRCSIRGTSTLPKFPTSRTRTHRTSSSRPRFSTPR